MKMKLKKTNLFGSVFFYRYLYLQSLKLMKFKNFSNLHLLPEYKYFNLMYFFLKKYEKSLFLFYFFKNLKNSILINPNIMFSKYLFNNSSYFKKFILKNNYKYLFITNNDFKYYHTNVSGNNLLIHTNNKFKLNDAELIKTQFEFDFFKKNEFIYNPYLNEINYFINFNLYIINMLEIYKILIYLHLNLLNN